MLKNGSIQLFFITSLLFLASINSVNAQKLWANVQLNKSSVYVGEPIEVSISVYTETWFTRGIDLGNVNVKGAFTTYFRPVSVSTTQKGKTFSGVQLKYHVFPYSETDLVFPTLKIEVETPPVGGYKGVKRTVKSPERKIKVKPVPPDFDKTGWLVASNLTVTEQWSGNKNQVKVGDVLARQITRKASGTLSELIPPTVWDSIATVSSYPGKSSVNNYRSKTAISSQRKESIQYLFEKEGTVVIPERVYTWFNPYRKKLFKRTLPAVKVNVQPNPNLGMLATVRDSLQLKQVKAAQNQGGKGPKTIFGLSIRDFILALLISVALFVFLIRLIKSFWLSLKEKHHAYRQSEVYFFNKLKKAIRKGDKKQLTNAFYRWLDELKLDAPTMQALMDTNYKQKPNDYNLPDTVKEVIKLRQDYLKIKHKTSNNNWITPVYGMDKNLHSDK